MNNSANEKINPRLFAANMEMSKNFPNGKTPALSPDLDFLNYFGLSDAVIISRWIQEVGPESFTEIILAFSEAGKIGRAKSDHSALIDEYDILAADNPSWGQFQLANAVVTKFWADITKWPQGFRPATQKAAAATIVRKIEKRMKERNNPAQAKKEAARAREIKYRVERRVKAMNERSARLLAVATWLSVAGPLLKELITAYTLIEADSYAIKSTKPAD